MTDIPSSMFATILKHEGYSGTMTGPVIEDAGDWLAEAELPVPQPGPGQVLIKLRTASVNPSDLALHQGRIRLNRGSKVLPPGLKAAETWWLPGKGAEALARVNAWRLSPQALALGPNMW